MSANRKSFFIWSLSFQTALTDTIKNPDGFSATGSFEVKRPIRRITKRDLNFASVINHEAIRQECKTNKIREILRRGVRGAGANPIALNLMSRLFYFTWHVCYAMFWLDLNTRKVNKVRSKRNATFGPKRNAGGRTDESAWLDYPKVSCSFEQFASSAQSVGGSFRA